jgi:hypothetical protein
LLLSVFTNQLSIYLSYLEDKEVLNGVVNNVAKVSETAMIESTSEENLDKDVQETTGGSSIISILKVNRPEWFYISVGCITSVITGSALPVYGLVFGDIIGVSIFVNFDFRFNKSFSFYLGFSR